MNQSDEAPGKENNEYEFSDNVTRRKIDKHLSDINDTISEEDINNVITNITSDEPNGMEPKSTEKEVVEKAEDPIEEATEMPTTWDVIE